MNDSSSRDVPLRTLSLSLVGLFLLAVFYTFYFARDFFLPIVLAVLLSFPLGPLVRALTRLRIPESLGAALVLLAAVGAISYTSYRVYPAAVQWMARVPDELREVRDRIRDLRKPVEEVSQAAKRVQQEMDEITDTEPAGEKPVQVVVDRPAWTDVLFASTGKLATAAVLTLVLLYFLLASGDLFLLKVVRVLPTLEDKKKAVEISRQVERNISSYLFTVTAINVGLGVVVGLAMALHGMPNPFLWGVMAALLNFVPYLGAILGVAVLTLVAMGTYDSIGRALLVPATFYLLTALEGYFITPHLLGRRLVLNPVVIFVSLIFWGWLWGVPGALLAVPILAAVKILCEQFESLTPVAEFLGR